MVGTMKRVLLLFPLLFAFAACGSDPAAPGSGEPTFPVDFTPGVRGFEAQLDTLRVGHTIPGMAAAIVENGQVVWSGGLGYADIAAGKPVTESICFHLASLTKPFASVIIMQLVEEGLIDLDDPVSDYGIDLSSSGVIRVRHLLTHTSEGTPGSAYRYNGSRFGQLDRVIESASGRTFGELLVERILEPLQLTQTAPSPSSPADFALTGLNRDEFMADMATPYEPRGSRVVRSEYATGFSSAAGLISSAHDMATFASAIDQGLFLQPATWQAVFTPAVSNGGSVLPYGLGWFVQERQGVELQWHYGYWNATSTLIVRAPAVGRTFIVMANTDMMSRPYDLGLGDVSRSPFARLFLDSYVYGNAQLPGATVRRPNPEPIH
jgi:CubicO group peptidase (beta-lactamase class C family)